MFRRGFLSIQAQDFIEDPVQSIPERRTWNS